MLLGARRTLGLLLFWARSALGKQNQPTSSPPTNNDPPEHPQVALRGNSTAPVGVKPVGTLHMTVTFMPFTPPAFDDDVETTPVKSGLTALLPFPSPPAREIVTNVSDFQKGLLTVKLIKASGLGLGAGSKKRSVDPYVQLVLTDCDPARPNETQTSGIKYNDGSPRWNEKFDFTFISAGSMVMVNVWDKTTLFEMVLSLKLSKQRFKVRARRVCVCVVVRVCVCVRAS